MFFFFNIVLTKKSSKKLRACKYYNSQKGCRDESTCKHLHVCWAYIFGYCKFWVKCKRSHNLLDHQPKSVLKKSGYDTKRNPEDLLRELKSFMSLKHVDECSESDSEESFDSEISKTCLCSYSIVTVISLIYDGLTL